MLAGLRFKTTNCQHPDSFVSTMASSKMSKGGSNRLAGRYEWREAWVEDCSHGGNDLFLGHGFHMLGPGASQKVHNAISHEDKSKIKMTTCGGLTTITVRLETITELGAIFIRDTIPEVRYLVRKYNVDKDEDNENGKTGATLKRNSANPKVRVKARTVGKTVLNKKPARNKS